MERIQDYISHLQGALTRLNLADVQSSINAVMDAYYAEKQIFVIGNGGSASTASHLACDLGKGTSVAGKPRFRVISLTDNVATMTAWANDVAYEDVFVEQLKNLVNPGDLVIGISASGNSENVLRAMRHAAELGCKTVGWCGFGGGELAALCDISVVVDSHRYGPVEDVHLVLNHVLHAWITEEFSFTEEDYMHRAKEKAMSQDYSGALEDYTEVIRRNPDNATAHYCRGNMKFELRNYAGAIPDYDETLRLNPSAGRAYSWRAGAKALLGDYAGAILDYTEFIRRAPADAKAYLGRGDAKVHLRDFEGGILDFNESLRLNPM